MTLLRAFLAITFALAAVSAVATHAAPAGKAKRLMPDDPPPASISVPEEPKVQVVGSCRLVDGSCSDYQGAFTGVDTKALCAAAKGTWSKGACPTEKSVGTCTQRQDGSEDRIVTRSYAPVSADAARKGCVERPRGIFLKGG